MANLARATLARAVARRRCARRSAPTWARSAPTRSPAAPRSRNATAIASSATSCQRSEVLDGPEMWPGMQIPIVPFIGEEVKIGRQVVRRGIVRVLKDVQRLYNYAISADAEAVALQPKAPFKGTRKNFENFLDQWETANTRNWPFLEYDPDPLNGGRPPEREPPPVASTGIKELLAVATSDMSAVTGIYPSSLGAPAQETQRPRHRRSPARGRHRHFRLYRGLRPRDRAHRPDRRGPDPAHLRHRAGAARGRRRRQEPARSRSTRPMIDPNGDGIDTITMNDVTVGTYQVIVEMGPSYSTKREEARDGMQTLMQTLGPQAAPLFADLFVKGQDFPLADQIAKRLRFMLPPQVAAAEAAKSGEPPPPPPPPPPPNPELAAQAGRAGHSSGQELQGKAALQRAAAGHPGEESSSSCARSMPTCEKARMANEATLLAHGVKASGQRMDYVDSQQQRVHETRIGPHRWRQDRHAAAAQPSGNGNGAAPVRTDQQQQQIDALINAVSDCRGGAASRARSCGADARRPRQRRRQDRCRAAARPCRRWARLLARRHHRPAGAPPPGAPPIG